MLVRTTINRAALALRASTATIVGLVRREARNGDLDPELPRLERWVKYGAGWTSLDIWRRFEARGFQFEYEVDVLPVLGVKRRLRLQKAPWSDAFLRALLAVRRGRRVANVEAKGVLRGYHESGGRR